MIIAKHLYVSLSTVDFCLILRCKPTRSRSTNPSFTGLFPVSFYSSLREVYSLGGILDVNMGNVSSVACHSSARKNCYFVASSLEESTRCIQFRGSLVEFKYGTVEKSL